MSPIEKRIREISKKLHLTHIGSCISILPILKEIYENKKPNDKVILDNAHAHLAHLLFINPQNAETLIKQYGIHCDRRAGCDASGGSLGHGIGIGIGMALVNRKRKIYCIVSDGSMQEGSNWEALRIKQQLKLKNLIIYCNFNGYTASAEVDRDDLVRRMNIFCNDIHVRYTQNGEGLEGIAGHYKTL